MPVQNPASVRRKIRIPKWTLVPAILSILAAGFLCYLAFHWPFTEKAVIQTLQAASSSTVEIGSFRSLYFPHPGCVARNVVFHFGSRTDIPPLISIEQMTIRSSLTGMLAKHVQLIRTDGLQVFIPRSSNKKFTSSSDVIVDQLITSKASLKFETAGKPKDFEIRNAELSNIGGASEISFHVRMTNAEPPGEVEANGHFGPWVVGGAGKTKVSGDYRFQDANLGVFRGIAGLLSSAGNFDGTLEHISVQGRADTPDFTVTSSRHRTELRNQFTAVINARDGDVSLERIDSEFRGTEITASGSVTGEKGNPGKTATLSFYSKDGRIQDLLLLFIKDERAPMSGTTSFRGHVVVPPGGSAFLRKVRLAGDFGADAGKFSNPQVQLNTDKLSAEARDKSDSNPATVVSSLRGHVEVKDGTATFNNLGFGIPGAFAELHGTYELISHKIDLHGTLKMDSSLSNLAHGPKALILVVLDPFFKRKPKGSQAPVKITGTYEHPSFGLDLTGNKKTKVGKRLERMYQNPRK